MRSVQLGAPDLVTKLMKDCDVEIMNSSKMLKVAQHIMPLEELNNNTVEAHY